MEISEKLEILLNEFKEKFGYELTEKNDDLDYLVFKRMPERNCTQVLLLEDHRWERGCEDFDPKNPWDIGDWLIFSMLVDDERDWFGHFVNTQYPLTYSEYKIIEQIILEIEKISK